MEAKSGVPDLASALSSCLNNSSQMNPASHGTNDAKLNARLAAASATPINTRS
jgi:hypothetical protein